MNPIITNYYMNLSKLNLLEIYEFNIKNIKILNQDIDSLYRNIDVLLSENLDLDNYKLLDKYQKNLIIKNKDFNDTMQKIILLEKLINS